MVFKVDIDKSPQGFIDPDINKLLEILNSKVDEKGEAKYLTTSSCSGRITVMSGVKKGEAKWEYKSHSEVDPIKIWQQLEKIQGENLFRFMYEPFIVHVKCKSVNVASEMLSILHSNGIKKSGMISVKKLIVEINDTGRMETVLDKSLSKEYIEKLVNEANKRLKSTKEKILKLEKLFS